MALPINYTDDVFEGNRKYTLINNADGTVSLVDVTSYTTEGSPIGAAQINTITAAVNAKQELTDSLTAETALVDADYIPFYDISATGHRKTLWSNIKSVLKTYFDALYATATHNQAASTVTAGTLAGQVLANASAQATLTTAQLRNVYAGTADMTAGSTALATGSIYIMYE